MLGGQNRCPDPLHGMTIRASFMREHFLSRHGHLGGEDLAVERVGDVERAALGAAIGDVGHEATLLAGVHEMGRQAVRVEAPDAHSQVAHDEAVLVVGLDAVGAGVAAGELDRDAGLGERAASMPSGPAWPPESWIATPVLESVPPAMSGSRQICCERVMATYTCVLLLLSVMPLGEGALSTRRCSSPFARRRYTRPLGSAMPVCPWSVK